MSTIVNLAQDFVGSNNINLLLPIGQFGTRLQGGKDSASPRYIFTQLKYAEKELVSNTVFCEEICFPKVFFFCLTKLPEIIFSAGCLSQ